MALICLGLFVTIVASTRYVSLGTICAVLFFLAISFVPVFGHTFYFNVFCVPDGGHGCFSSIGKIFPDCFQEQRTNLLSDHLAAVEPVGPMVGPRSPAAAAGADGRRILGYNLKMHRDEDASDGKGRRETGESRPCRPFWSVSKLTDPRGSSPATAGASLA
jgi:hypothetical protein